MSPCPICQAPVAPGARTFPFCSPRCQLIDLGNWLGERYVIPGPPEDGPAQGAAEADEEGKDKSDR